MGCDLLIAFEVTLQGLIAHVTENPQQLKAVLDKHAGVFTDGLGCLQGQQVHLYVDKKVTPKFCKPRTVPLALKGKVEAELERLETLGIISQVQFSSWAAPIVPVVKKDGSVHICGDYKATINQAALTVTYPLPRVEDLFANLSGGKQFSKLDLSNAYLQLPLDEESSQLVCINTHKGLFKFNRLPFGVSSAPAIFQRCMASLFQELKGVSVFIDDILVTGPSTEEHLATLEKVLQVLEVANMRLNKSKCFFFQKSVEYLGHRIDDQGIHPTDEKVAAIREASKPRNVSDLRAFLGIVNYYGKFLPNLSMKLSPLYNLLRKKVRWTWGPQHDAAFQSMKEALQTNSLLVHFDSAKPLLLACDASQYGLGAVLSHVMDNGQERPIAYASRTLNSAENNYSQLEKEGLAIIFGVSKFHNYLYHHQFEIESDHQPLSYLFSEKKRTLSVGIVAHSEVGVNPIELPVHHSLQGWEKPEQCRCTESSSSTCYLRQ